MDEHHQHDNGEHGSAQVYESTVQSDARLREDRDQGHVGTFEAKAEERGNNAEARGGNGKEARQDRDPGRVGTFDAEAEERGKNVEALGRKIQALDDIGRVVAAGFYVYAWQRQATDFYGMRLRKNFEFGRRFAEVDGIADLVGLQREYVRDTLLDYASSAMTGFGLRGPQQTAERLDR
jgi:hypothetical protein